MATVERDGLVERRGQLLRELAGIGDLRQGSLRTQYRKCGKPNCHCAVEGAQGHGPYWLLTWLDRRTGKTRGRSIPANAVEGTRAEIAEYRRLRALVRALVEVSGQICDARLDADKPARPVKRGSLHASIAHEVEAEVERLLGEGVVEDFQAVEMEARRVAFQIMGRAVAGKLNADRSDESGARLPCDCGGEARFAGRRLKTFTTARWAP